MPKKQTEEQALMRVWWVRILLALAYVGVAYGFISLAIDTGSLWQYAVGIGFLAWAIKDFIRGAQTVIHR